MGAATGVTTGALTRATEGTGCTVNNHVKLGLYFFALSFSKKSRHSVKRLPWAIFVCQSAAITVTGGVIRVYT